jgi:alpha-1,4-digalacturonate transport system permease protein
MMGMALVSILPMLLIFFLFQRHFVRGIASTGLK